jgi:transposase
MAAPKVIYVKEDLQFLRNALKTSSLYISPRIKMLIEIKKHEDKGISKRDLAEIVGVNHNSIQTWRTMYVKGGIELILSHKRIGYKPSIISEDERKRIEGKLKDPFNGLRGYKELLSWIETELDKQIEYNTLYKYCVREFGSAIKVARKSHVNKIPEAVDAFKKTSHNAASKQ